MKLFCAILLLLGAAIYTVKTRFVQFRKLFAILRQPFQVTAHTGSGISAFEAAATSLAATIGTGNIAGVAGAILLGGPGAVFWIWVSGAFGMALKYAEVLIAMRYRRRGSDGDWRGGPMYCIRLGLPKRWHSLGYLFALCGMFAALGMGDLVQVTTVAESAEALGLALGFENTSVYRIAVRLLSGVLTALLLYGVLSGGAKRIGRLSALLVPLMSFVYLFLCILVVFVHRTMLLAVLSNIFQAAFRPEAVLGAGAGIGFRSAFRTGMLRGIFSHEAGLGTAAIAHSCAEASTPQNQARFGAFEVFFDVLICTVTAIVILVSGIPLPYGNAEINSTLVIDALSTCFHGTVSAAIIAVSLLLFAFTSMTGFALYGGRCAEFFFGRRVVQPYGIAFVLLAAIGPLLPRSVAWDAAELMNAALCLPNLIAMAVLTRRNQSLSNALRE